MGCDFADIFTFKDKLSEMHISEVSLMQVAYDGIDIDIPALGSFIFEID